MRLGLNGMVEKSPAGDGITVGQCVFLRKNTRSLQWSSVRLVLVVGPVFGVGTRRGCRWGMGLARKSTRVET